jgi:hypothetical protein
MLDRMLATPALYIVALPRTALIEEMALYLKAHATSPRIVIEPIHSDQPGHRGDVPRRVEKALGDHSTSTHVIVLTSHETFLRLNVSLMRGWHVGIDENIDSAVMSGSFSATASWSMLQRHYELDRLGVGGTSEVLPRSGVAPLKHGAITRDVAQSLAAFHKCATNRNRSVFVDLDDWVDASEARRKIRWWSIWTPMSLEGCASVTIAAAGYFDSLPYHAARWLHGDEITFSEEKIGAHLVRAKPKVRVHYYSLYAGNTQWWVTYDGSECLKKIADHQAGIGGVGYYSCNASLELAFNHRFSGERRDPKLAGTNELIHHTSCLFIYSNKAQEADTAILDLLGLDRGAIRQTREYEDLWQFALRGIVRRPDYGGDYDVYVYDLAQAESLKGYLVATGITDSVELVPVHEAGIMDSKPPASPRVGKGTKRSPLTNQERRKKDAERKQRERAKDKEERIANGAYRPPGAPKKVKPSLGAVPPL